MLGIDTDVNLTQFAKLSTSEEALFPVKDIDPRSMHCAKHLDLIINEFDFKLNSVIFDNANAFFFISILFVTSIDIEYCPVA